MMPTKIGETFYCINKVLPPKIFPSLLALLFILKIRRGQHLKYLFHTFSDLKLEKNFWFIYNRACPHCKIKRTTLRRYDF